MEKENNIDGQPAKTSTTVTIRIIDLNDNKPEFYNCTGECDYSSDKQDSFTGYIEEHSSTGVSVANLTIVARDPDEVSLGSISLFLFIYYCTWSWLNVTPGCCFLGVGF